MTMTETSNNTIIPVEIPNEDNYTIIIKSSNFRIFYCAYQGGYLHLLFKIIQGAADKFGQPLYSTLSSCDPVVCGDIVGAVLVSFLGSCVPTRG